MQLKEPQDQRGLKKLILRNNDKYRKRSIDLLLLMESTRLDMSHIQSYINSMPNNNFNNKKIYLERKKCIMLITLFNV